MKKIIISLVAASVLVFSCKKKTEEAIPGGSANTAVAEAATPTAKSFKADIEAIKASLNPSFTQTSATSGDISIGETKLHIEQVGEETYVSLPETKDANFRIKSKLLSGTGSGGSGEFGGVLINITRANAKQVVNFFEESSEEKYGIWGALFGDKTGEVFYSGPDDNFVFKPKLNTKKLPKGFFELNGKMSAKKTGTTAKGGKEVQIVGEAGLFSFEANELEYDDFGEGSFKYFYTTKFTDKDEITAFGKKYIGTADGEFEKGFVFIVGLGKGSGTPPMNGVLLALTLDGTENNIKSVNLILGAFGKVKVK